ncbi:hypothetical protein CMUS01_06781 [Colletotrichum musicola]|uniref:Uncharacterized protein n=1 Tax=Colletotrichum musicola TaxID=2175873 RepID=A0A8H6NHM4_9PEZI|nr:hypothetical protein CMUS01_06781 [Colletotrichum musicola]
MMPRWIGGVAASDSTEYNASSETAFGGQREPAYCRGRRWTTEDPKPSSSPTPPIVSGRSAVPSPAARVPSTNRSGGVANFFSSTTDGA